MAPFSELSEELVFALLQYCEIETWVAVGLTSKRFSSWFNERIFWISALTSTRLSRPIACPFYADLANRSLASLIDIGRRTLRLERNWTSPLPKTTAPPSRIDLHHPGVNILLQVPGTMLYLLHMPREGMVVCWDMELRKQVSGPLRAANQIVDVSPGQEDPGSYSMGLLLCERGLPSMVIVKIAFDDDRENVQLSYTFQAPLGLGPSYWAMFLTREVVGVVSQLEGGNNAAPVNIIAYNIASQASTLIETDVVPPGDDIPRPGSSTYAGDLFLLIEDGSLSHLYRFPESLLPTNDKLVLPKVQKFTAGTPNDKGTPAKEYCDMIDWGAEPDCDGEHIIRTYSEGALSGDPYYGVPATSLHRHIVEGTDDGDGPRGSRVEIRFWTSNKEGDILDTESSSAQVRPRPSRHTLLPHRSAFIQGIVYETDVSAWRLLLIPHSGRVLVMVVNVGKDRPVLMLVRFHPERKECTIHTLELPDEIPLANINGLGIDDYCGVISLLDTQGVMYFLSYS